MKKIFCFALLAAMLVSVCVLPLSAGATAVETPTDVPKVIITTNKNINTSSYVDCEIKIIDEKGGVHETITDSGSSIKIRGNSTSSAAKKPYNFKFSSKTEVLGMGKGKKWSLLANAYEKTLIRNQAVMDFADNIGLDYTPDYRVVDVYLNKQFLGSYLLTDPIEAGGDRVDIDNEGYEYILERDARTDEGTVYFESPLYGIRFGINEPEEPTDDQYNWLMDFLAKAENAISSGDYNEIKKYFDMDSMVDFYIVLEFFKNVDVEVGSTRFYIKEGKIHGGPVWDFDLSSGNCSWDYYKSYNNVYGSGKSYEGLWCNKLWYQPLLNNVPEFRNAVYARFLDLQDEIVNLYSDNILGKNYIDRTVSKYKGSIVRNYTDAGWKIDVKYSAHIDGGLERTPDSTYEENLAYYRDWLANRNIWLLKHWGLSSDVKTKSGATAKIDGFFIKNVISETKVSTLLADFQSGVSAYNGEAKLSNNDLVPNGSYLTVGGASYTVIVLGDTNSNAAIDIHDYAILKRAYLKTHSIDNTTFISADINENGILDALDYAMLKRHYLGTYDIYD